MADKYKVLIASDEGTNNDVARIKYKDMGDGTFAEVVYMSGGGGGGGGGLVNSVNGIAPDVDGDIVVTFQDVGALPDSYVPTWASITGKPSTFAPTIGTTATTAKAGNYVPAWGDVTGKPTDFTPAPHTHVIADVTNLQNIIDDLTTRIEALESA